MIINEDFKKKLNFKLIGDRVKLIRGEKSQTDFATELGLSQMDISRVERGEVKHIPDFLYNIAVSYGKTLDWIIAGEERISKPAPPQEVGNFVLIPQVSGTISTGTG